MNQEEAMAVAQQWATLAGQANTDDLAVLLTDNYVHIHATALVESKSQFLEAFKAGTRKYDPIIIEDAAARVWDGCAVVTGKFKLKAFTRDRTIEGVNRFALVVVRTPAGVQVASFQATGIPQPK